jgi:hypothetical protein
VFTFAGWEVRMPSATMDDFKRQMRTYPFHQIGENPLTTTVERVRRAYRRWIAFAHSDNHPEASPEVKKRWDEIAAVFSATRDWCLDWLRKRDAKLGRKPGGVR